MSKPKRKPTETKPAGSKSNEPKTKGSNPDQARTKYTAFRCPEDLLELAKHKASRARRSLSNYLVYLIAEDVKNSDG
jgi:hypothetical protein